MRARTSRLRRQPRHRQAPAAAPAARLRSAPSRRGRPRATATPPPPDGTRRLAVATLREGAHQDVDALLASDATRVEDDEGVLGDPEPPAGLPTGLGGGRDVARQVDPGEDDADRLGAQARALPNASAVSARHRQRAVHSRREGRSQRGTARGGGRHRWKTTGAPAEGPRRHRVGEVPVAVHVDDVGPEPPPGPHPRQPPTRRRGERVAPAGERPVGPHHGPGEALPTPRRSRPRSRRRGRRGARGRRAPGSWSAASARGLPVRRGGWRLSGCARTVTIQGRFPPTATTGGRHDLREGYEAGLI